MMMGRRIKQGSEKNVFDEIVCCVQMTNNTIMPLLFHFRKKIILLNLNACLIQIEGAKQTKACLTTITMYEIGMFLI
jgi:hypothetical protein